MDAITVATVVLASVLFVAAPENPPGPDRTDPHVKALAPAMFFAFWMLPVAITVAKGKLITAALAVLNPVFGWIGAVRLAKPGSPFAQLRYRTRPAKMARARAREAAWGATRASGAQLVGDPSSASPSPSRRRRRRPRRCWPRPPRPTGRPRQHSPRWRTKPSGPRPIDRQDQAAVRSAARAASTAWSR